MLEMTSNPSMELFSSKCKSKTLPSLKQILSFELDTKMTIIFFNYVYNYLIITIIKSWQKMSTCHVASSVYNCNPYDNLLVFLIN